MNKCIKQLLEIKTLKSFKYDHCIFIYNENLFNIEHFNNHYLTLFDGTKLEDIYPGICIKRDAKMSLLLQLIGSGQMIVYSEKGKDIYSFELPKTPLRSVSESKTEPESISGARDGFIENEKYNLALIQSRLKSQQLSIRKQVVGKKTLTAVDILSIDSITPSYYLDLIVHKIENLDVDGVVLVEDIAELFEDNILIPKTHLIGSPDLASRALLNGQVIIVIDKISVVLELPNSFTLFSKVGIDYFCLKGFSFIERILTFSALFLSVLFLGLFFSFITYEYESLSLFILSIFKTSEQGTVLPLFFEILFILFLFEIYHLLAFKANKVVLSSMIVMVGGIIIGQNAVDSKFVSVFMMTLIALCFLSQFAITSDYKIVFSLSCCRLILLAFSLLYGLFGFTIGTVLVCGYIYYYDSMGTPFLYPLIPFDFKGLKQDLFSPSDRVVKSRPLVLNLKNRRKKK